MKKTFISFLFLSVLFAFRTSAQTVIYHQNFDGSSSLPAGWYATPNSWYNDTTLGNSSTGYTGASGVNNLVIKDTTAALGDDSLITASITTTGYDNITVIWGNRFSKHFADSGSTVKLYWSTNRSTWTNVSFTEDTNNSNWYLDNDATPIPLPAGAANQASLWLMWVADIHFTPSGTYRIDDMAVSGTSSNGINTISAEGSFASVFMGNSDVNIRLNQPAAGDVNVEIYDLSGRMVTKTRMEAQTLAIDSKSFSAGIYLVRVYDANSSTVTKVSVR